ncbi:MAG TPA: hypothetical protein VN520_19775 [Streptomyces sp.]|uniref:hypothetical protein n=1 Tax=Streptomyces sp. TaxID=1931 RepID=UPI002C6085CD|nr:hypothetical protein [Streptomyces sp.]HWU08586.1 hypothetical protein [Streptomyces sp.]
MTLLILPLAALVLSVIGPLLATAVAVLAHDPARRTDARHVLTLLLNRPLIKRRQHQHDIQPPTA